MSIKYTKTQLTLLVILRVIIGWHFLYEGFAKLLNANWTAQSYLLDSKGFMAEVFYWMANTPEAIKIVDFLNIWGLILIGFGLILGLLTRPALIGGIVLLAFYYLSHPAIIGVTYSMPSEGSYLIVNKILIELAALLVLTAFPTEKIIGLDRFVTKFLYSKKNN